MFLKSLWSTLLLAFSKWNQHEAPRLGAALAFYTMLSLAPLIIFVIAVVALAFGHSAAQNQIVTEMQSIAGQEGASVAAGVTTGSYRKCRTSKVTIMGLSRHFR